jgi:hypothetical protein
MFEAQAKETSGGTGMLIGACIVVVLAIVGTLAYLNQKGGAKSATPAVAAIGGVPAAQANADAVKDLHIVSAKMDKDYTGTMAVWSVEVKNTSGAYTYSNIGYETTYFGSDNSVLLQNQGKVSLSLGPGDEESTQFRDALYPGNTAWYKFRVVGAEAAK